MMSYRSLSFHEGWPDPRLIELGARLGFNDVCFQTERGLLGKLEMLRERANRSGYFELIRKHSMTSSLWAHEFADYDKNWGTPSAGNKGLWDAIARRYNVILGEQFPEVDNIVLTVVETQVKATDPEILVPLVETILGVCNKHKRRLIVRSFVHHPSELEEVTEAIARLPDEVTIMTKAVPQDWHLRSIDDPLIGKVAPKRQFIEVDIAGEYFRMDHVANCFTDVLESQYRRWVAAGCDGVSVRVDRGWNPWEMQQSVYGKPQEVNLWVLGYLSSGKAESSDEVWDAYARESFGEESAVAMRRALRPTGNVVAEGLYVKDEPFGESKYQYGHPLVKLPKDETAIAYGDNDDRFRRNPFHMAWAVFRWDPAHVAEYHQIRRGDPGIIAQKERSYADALESAQKSLEAIDSVKDTLDENAYRFFRFKLEENEIQLQIFCEMQLAWLKLSCRLFECAPEMSDRFLGEAVDHLRRARLVFKSARDQGLTVVWKGSALQLRHAMYVDMNEFEESFRRYWQLS